MLFSHLFWWLYFILVLHSHLNFDFCIVSFSIVVSQILINLWFYYFTFFLLDSYVSSFSWLIFWIHAIKNENL
jgi:hypothetical protein